MPAPLEAAGVRAPLGASIHARGVNFSVFSRDATSFDLRQYDWEGDRPLRRPLVETVIYELHVAGLTKHKSSGVVPARRGTYAGLIDKIPYLIPYLQDLGITAVVADSASTSC